MIILGQLKAVLVSIWWCWVSMARYCLVLGGTGSVWGGTGWSLVVLGHFNLVLLGIKLNWVSTTLLCLCILKKMKIWLDVSKARRQTTNKER